MENNPISLELLAQNLRCPQGEAGRQVADYMNVSNREMIQRTINKLQPVDHDRILELGPGNGRHVADLMRLADKMSYEGLDISEDMVAECRNIAGADSAHFQLYDGKSVPFDDESFDKVFTVNTVYFWDEPGKLAGEIARVLRPGGILLLTFADKQFMQQLPFVSYGFRLYDHEEAGLLLKNAGFSILQCHAFVDEPLTKTGERVKRSFWVLEAQKAFGK